MTYLTQFSNIYDKATAIGTLIQDTQDSEKLNKLLKKQRKLIRKMKILRDALCLCLSEN